MLEKIISLLAPHNCIVCGNVGPLICEWCADETIEQPPSRCFRCYTLTEDSAVCDKCSSGINHVWIRSIYINKAKELVYRLKFERTKSAAENIAELLDEAIPFLSKATIVTWVPTATSRVRLRGYDQSYLIARRIAKMRGLRLEKLLIRNGQARQVGSSRAARIRQAELNYSPAARTGFSKEVLLIDDIVTTGASIEAAAKILKKSGVKRVNAAVFAQKI